jgi:ABC-2 type transport system permease protein
MNARVFRLELRRSRTLLFWLALTMVLYGGLMAAYYPTLVRDTATVEQILKSFPKEMLAAFSIEGNLSDQGAFFNAYVLSLVWPIVAVLAGILIPTRMTVSDLERGFLELSLTTPVSRTRYLVTAIAVQLAAMAILAAATTLAIAGVLPLVGVSIEPARYLVVGLLAFAFGCAISAATTLLAVGTLSRGIAGGIVAGALLVMYLLQTVAKLVPDLSAISYLSVFHYFSPTPVLDQGSVPAGDLAVFAAVAVACWAGAVWLFRRRDLIG